MKNFKELIFENKAFVIIIFILSIIMIYGFKPISSVQEQSVVLTAPQVEKNPYKIAIDKCSEIEMSREFTDKCIEWELKNGTNK